MKKREKIMHVGNKEAETEKFKQTHFVNSQKIHGGKKKKVTVCSLMLNFKQNTVVLS